MNIIASPYFSGALFRRMSCFVALPDGYDAAGGERYPVIYMLHGLYGSESDWIRRGHIGATIEAMTAAGELRDCILVMASDGGYGHGTFYMNWHDGTGNFEDGIADDLVQHIDEEYRTLAGKEHRAVCGLSMGGFGAVFLALRRPDLFGAAASISGALGSAAAMTAKEYARSDFPRMLGAQRGEYARELSLAELAGKRLSERTVPTLYANCGTEDFLLPLNRALHEQFKTIGYPLQFEEFVGEHNWDYFGVRVKEALRFIERRFAAAEGQ